MRLPLIDGQGNFGSVERRSGRRRCRYTECRLARPSLALLDDIDKNTVVSSPTTTTTRGSRQSYRRASPTCSSTGPVAIAVGMATKHPAAQSRRDHRRLHRP